MMWTAAVVVQSELLTRQSAGEIEEDHEMSVKIAYTGAKI
jgi:hypothetical protein